MCDLGSLSSLSFSGEGLSVESLAGLEVACAKRSSEEGIRNLQFWGKVKGTDNDYLVVCGHVGGADYPEKKFFWCTEGAYNLQALPELTEEFAAKAAGLTGRLKGDPSALPDGEEEEEEEEEEEDEDGVPKPKKVKFSEAHRLAYAISQIDADTAVVPRGAYIVTATHDVLQNRAFEGLDSAAAGGLDNYFHFRKPVALARKTALERSGMVASTDFLDPLSEDTPRGVWSVRVDDARGAATGRSLLWPGYFFFHNVGSAGYGGAYFGYGTKNGDIGFMV